MSKKILVFLIIVILAVASGGFFYWWKTSPKEWLLLDTFDVTNKKAYVIEKNKEKMLIRNEETNFSFQLNKNWTYSDQNVYLAGSDMSFYGPESIINQETDILEKGCKVTISISNIKIDIPLLEKGLKEKFVWDSIRFNEYENRKIGEHKTIKHIFEDEKLKIYFVGIHIPLEDKLLEIVLEAALQDKERCEKEFEEILSTASFLE